VTPEAEARCAARRIGLLAVRSNDGVGTDANLGLFQLIDARGWRVVAGPAFDLRPDDVIRLCTARPGSIPAAVRLTWSRVPL
jgi:hypothetical protein